MTFWNAWISINISLKLVPKGTIYNKSAFGWWLVACCTPILKRQTTLIFIHYPHDSFCLMYLYSFVFSLTIIPIHVDPKWWNQDQIHAVGVDVLGLKRTRDRFNINVRFYQYRDSHYKDKIASDGNPYRHEKLLLYWNEIPQTLCWTFWSQCC